jgi:hypothetical protein
MNAAMKNPTGVSKEAAVTGEVREQRKQRSRRQLIFEVCECGERLPHAMACAFTIDPEICS